MIGQVRWLTRAVTVVWLLVFQPLDLAVTLGTLIVRPDLARGAAYALLAARMGTVGVGLATGLAITRQAAVAWPLARLWALGEAVTLTVVWTTQIWPTNRPPGLLVPTAVVYVAGMVCALYAAYTVDQRPADGTADLLRPPPSR